MNSKKTPQDDPKQSERFIETAKSLSTAGGGKEFAQVIRKIIPKKTKHR